MSEEKKLAVITSQAIAPLELMPLGAIITRKKELDQYIQHGLQKDKDFGVIPGTRKPTLYKPGAEQVLAWFNCRAEFDVFKAEHKNPDVFYGVKCKIYQRNSDMFLGEGLGSCSTIESKYRSRPHDLDNTILKMAKKRSLVDAVLGVFGLSDRFTQDVEDAVVIQSSSMPPKREWVQQQQTTPGQIITEAQENYLRSHQQQSGPLDNKQLFPDDDTPPVGEHTAKPGTVPAMPEGTNLRDKIIDRVTELSGASAAGIGALLRHLTAWGNSPGVSDPSQIKYDVKPGKSKSQAEVVYGKLKDMTQEQATAIIKGQQHGN